MNVAIKHRKQKLKAKIVRAVIEKDIESKHDQKKKSRNKFAKSAKLKSKSLVPSNKYCG